MVGMVLEGGGMRGLYTAGVLDTLMHENITADLCVGVSAGAVFGCNYKSRQIGRALRYNCRYGRDPRYASFRSLLTTGDYFGAKFCYETLPFELDVFDLDAYRQNPMKFYVTTTDVETGRPVYYSCPNGDERDLLYMRASASLPFISRIVETPDGRKLLDGGFSDSIPVKFARRMGCDKTVLVLTRPAEYRKGEDKSLPLMRAAYRRYPALIRAAELRARRYNKTLDYIRELEDEGEIFVIRPSREIGISRTEKDPLRLTAAHALGVADCQSVLPALRAYLAHLR